MVLETSVLSIFNQLTRLEARENFINFSRRESFKSYFFLSLWSTTTLSTLKSHLNTYLKENPMFAGRQLQWPLSV
jgi:hypothetical protein